MEKKRTKTHSLADTLKPVCVCVGVRVSVHVCVFSVGTMQGSSHFHVDDERTPTSHTHSLTHTLAVTAKKRMWYPVLIRSSSARLSAYYLCLLNHLHLINCYHDSINVCNFHLIVPSMQKCVCLCPLWLYSDSEHGCFIDWPFARVRLSSQSSRLSSFWSIFTLYNMYSRSICFTSQYIVSPV